MRLKDNLYRIIGEPQHENEVSLYCLEIIPSSSIYEGHFPNHPITPGAVILKIVEELVGTSVSCCSNVKFLVPIIPDCIKNIEVRISTTTTGESPKKYSVTIKNENTTFAKLTVSD